MRDKQEKTDTKNESKKKAAPQAQSQIPEEEPNMFSRRHQIQQLKMGKRMPELIDMFDKIVFGCMRHLIHVFVGVTGIAIIGMVIVLMQEEPSVDRYQRQATREMASIFNLFAQHHKLGPRIKDASGVLDEYARKFVDFGPADGHSVVVHPLYASLQDESPLSLTQEKPYQLYDHEYDQQSKPISTKLFYRRHVSKSLPCVFRKQYADEYVIKELKKMESQKGVDELMKSYIREGHPDKDMYIQNALHPFLTITILHKKERKSADLNGTYDQFVEARNQAYPNIDTFVFIENAQVGLDTLQPSQLTESKMVMKNLMKPIDRRLTQWRDFPNRRAQRLNFEQHICVYHGSEEFRIVSPIYKKNLYINVFDEHHQEETPIDFFEPRPDKYPLVKQINWLKTTLFPGDCLYVPAYFYVQSRTVGPKLGLKRPWDEESILVVDQYESHSKFIDLIMRGLDQDKLEETNKEENKKFDNAIKEVVGWLGIG